MDGLFGSARAGRAGLTEAAVVAALATRTQKTLIGRAMFLRL